MPSDSACSAARYVGNRAADQTQSETTRNTSGSGWRKIATRATSETTHSIASSSRVPPRARGGDVLGVPLPREVADAPDDEDAGEVPGEPRLGHPRVPAAGPGDQHARGADDRAGDAADRRRCAGARQRAGRAEALGAAGAQQRRAPAPQQGHGEPGLEARSRAPPGRSPPAGAQVIHATPRGARSAAPAPIAAGGATPRAATAWPRLRRATPGSPSGRPRRSVARPRASTA